MLSKENFTREIEKLLNLLFGLQFAAEPQRACCGKRLAATWRVRHGGFDDAVKFEQWLVVENYVIELRSRDARFGEAVVSGVARQSRVVFLARKSLFLGRCDYLAVFD